MLSKAGSSVMAHPEVSDKTRRIGSAYVSSVASIMLVIVITVLVVYQLTPPRPAAVNSALTEFSGERALKHLTVIAQKPHPVGSSEHTAVANYIQHELTALGLSPEVQQTAALTNILVRLKGTSDEK